MNQLRSRFNRLLVPCPKCHGTGQSGVFKKHPCSKCGGTGQIKTRPSWVGFAVVFGMLVGLAMLMGIAMLIANPVAAADSTDNANPMNAVSSPPSFEIIVEHTGSETDMAESAPCHVSGNYPDSIMQWCELITAAAHKYGIPSDMIAAVMLQESGGQPDLPPSVSGAIGLMQVMPRDGIAADFQCINGPCFADRPTTDELYDPVFNIDYGAGILTEKYEELGDWREALKAYGPMDCGYSYADIVLKIFDNYK